MLSVSDECKDDRWGVCSNDCAGMGPAHRDSGYRDAGHCGRCFSPLLEWGVQDILTKSIDCHDIETRCVFRIEQKDIHSVWAFEDDEDRGQTEVPLTWGLFFYNKATDYRLNNAEGHVANNRLDNVYDLVQGHLLCIKV